LDSGVAGASCCDEAFRGIDGPDGVGPQTPDELGRQRPGTAADIEHALTGCDARELGETRGQRYRVPAHESVVLVRPDAEAHLGTRRRRTRRASRSGTSAKKFASTCSTIAIARGASPAPRLVTRSRRARVSASSIAR